MQPMGKILRLFDERENNQSKHEIEIFSEINFLSFDEFFNFILDKLGINERDNLNIFIEKDSNYISPRSLEDIKSIISNRINIFVTENSQLISNTEAVDNHKISLLSRDTHTMPKFTNHRVLFAEEDIDFGSMNELPSEKIVKIPPNKKPKFKEKLLSEYSGCNIKKNSSLGNMNAYIDPIAEAKKLVEENTVLKSKIVVLEESNKKLKQNISIIEKHIKNPKDFLLSCRKEANNEWQKRIELLTDKIIANYSQIIEKKVNEKFNDYLILKKKEIVNCLNQINND